MAWPKKFKAWLENFKSSLKAFTPEERRNIIYYILGIMVFKFGLEAYSGSISVLATNRYEYDAKQKNGASENGASEKSTVDKNTFERLAVLQGCGQAFQCVGSILIAPLIKRFPTKNVLTCAISFYGLMTAVLLIVDAATGGSFLPQEYRGVGKHPKDSFDYYGRFPTDAMIPISCLTGLMFGMVDLIRRVIPRDIVGGDIKKLQKMDSLVHIFYEVAGTSSAFCTALVLIPQLGTNRSFIITPICFAISGTLWYFISDLGFTRHEKEAKDQSGILKGVLSAFYLFGESVCLGGKILFTSRKFIWLVPSYGIAFYAHRYLENGVTAQVAKRYFEESAWSQIMAGGSNFGELLGALVVFFTTGWIKTPIPWLRMDAFALLILWYIPFWDPPKNEVKQAWIAAATLIPISFGWAAGDVSLAAYIQSALSRLESQSSRVSPLGAVMSFLYCFYITSYAIAGPFLGRYLDHIENIREGLRYTVGVQFTVVSALIMASTFVPRGSFALNPDMLSGENLEDSGDVEKKGGKDNGEIGEEGLEQRQRGSPEVVIAP